MARTTRPPIVAVMGHIDHGKSSLLDYIRKANVVAGEAGGITQHVSAYEAQHEYEGAVRTITFLDTPGHEAFQAIRARGAATADIAILVVASDEGVKPQTAEAWNAITEAGIPYIVAFTKMDKNGADLERVKMGVIEAGIYLEGLGGSVPYASVSSKSGDGIPELLDLVLLTADLAELTYDPDAAASGYVLESSQDPRQGQTATLILKEGTLATGTYAIASTAIAPIRFIEDFKGTRIKDAKASQPVRIAGWNALPAAGTPFLAVANKKEAEKLAAAIAADAPKARDAALPEGTALLPLILKADVSGSVEAIKHELAKVEHERVVVRIIGEGLGAVSEGDVKLAMAGGANIIAFNVGTDSNARDLADRSQVAIETFSIIYDLKEHIEKLVAASAPRITVEEITGEAKVLKAFNATGTKQTLGARWISGALEVGDMVKVDRRGLPIGTAKLTNLQVARADVKEIHVEGEFGLQIDGKAEAAPGDTLFAYRMIEK
ncbi:MAG TPA: translation initiation factor IF-2 [Candidatus Paceibacterota bacterium]|nr:translation initiation factor IF-2 [Candidatus Paceibacterota bacterium]